MKNTQKYSSQSSIQQVFRAQVRLYPDRTAVVLPGSISGRSDASLSYLELDQRSDALALILMQQGLQSGAFVGLYLDRSLETIIAMLAILKAGAVYVPLDPAYPNERLLWMLRDSQVAIVLTVKKYLQSLENIECPLIDLDDLVASATIGSKGFPPGQGADPAYVIYTSGSTGQPKGVLIPHRAVTRLVRETNYVTLDSASRLLQISSVSFDAATFEIWGALLNGGCCVLYPGQGAPDPQRLKQLIDRFKISATFITASLFNAIIDEFPEAFLSIAELLVGGEALSVAHIKKAQKCLPNTQLINGYGPTENTTFSTSYRIPRQLSGSEASIPIGQPIAHSQAYILDNQLQPVSDGSIGELCVAGEGLAIGYLNRPESTAASFVTVADGPLSGTRVYKTGDRVSLGKEGNIEYQGRVDDQIKLYGHRIELGEIEAALRRQTMINDAVVRVHQRGNQHKVLLAYVTVEKGHSITEREILSQLSSGLPDYMLPARVIILSHLPLTRNGKIDKKALPQPDFNHQEVTDQTTQPATGIEAQLSAVWTDLLKTEISATDHFFDCGGNSLLAMQCVARLQKQQGLNVPIVQLYQFPVLKDLAAAIEQANELDANSEHVPEEQQQLPGKGQGIAIIGMAGRFPGAEDTDQFWQNLCDGVESITRFSREELAATVPQNLLDHPDYVKARGILKHVDQFDATFFGISPREAEIMDPQQRIFLEIAWHALENSGYGPGCEDGGKVGVYAGMNNNTYFSENVRQHPDKIEQYGEFNAMLASETDFLTTRVSFKLDLTGPSVNLFTACSTSLTAIGVAAEALRSGRCDMALAGGISVIVPQQAGYLYQEGSMLSPDGHCRAFDVDAKGTTFNSGGAAIVLKREADAVADGDTVYAIIRGVGMNNDGSDKASFTAPGIKGQVAAIKAAQAQAEVSPESISYIETHGTGTPLGDPIEVAALTQAFKSASGATGYCGMGSLKSNVGHLIHAAGVASVIKTALSLKHQVIPASLFYSAANSSIDFASTPFFVNDTFRPWPEGESPRRAGVSGFGVGGSNAHLILEEAPRPTAGSESRPQQLLLLSARSQTALARAAEDLSEQLRSNPDQDLADVAYTLQRGRKMFKHRLAVVCRNPQDAIEGLVKKSSVQTFSGKLMRSAAPLVFMFPGQGSQYLGMGSELYLREPVYQQAMDDCLLSLPQTLADELRLLLLEPENKPGDQQKLAQTQYTQPALFMTEYALAKLWQSWGIQPQAMIGHSIGEFVAACLAGVFSLAQGIQLVAERAALMQAMPAGDMLSVRLSADALTAYLDSDVSLAAVNGPQLCVASGPHPSVEKLQAQLEAQGIVCRTLHTSHAFHSSMMEPVVAPFLARCEALDLSAPAIPIMSTVTGDWLTADQATDPAYWAGHLRQTVRFAEAIAALWQQPERLLLEVGPRTTTATLARQQSADKRQQIAISSLSDQADDHREWQALLAAIGQLWLHDVVVDWAAFYRHEQRRRVPLPGYPFERKRYWLEAKPANAAEAQSTLTPAIAPAITAPIKNRAILVQQPRKQKIIEDIKQVIDEISGIAIETDDEAMTFLQLGLDSLVLTQASLAFKNKFAVDITFRQLLETYTTVDALADYLDQELPADAYVDDAAKIAAPQQAEGLLSAASPLLNTMGGDTTLAQQVIAQQLQLMSKQLELLGGAAASAPVAVPQAPATQDSTPDKPPVKRSGASSRATSIQKNTQAALTAQQQKALAQLIQRYTAATPRSKQFTEQHRAHLSDPRTVSGFTPLLKEMVYPIVTDRAQGSKLWDIDENKYIDVNCGFGVNFFGWSPDFVTQAVTAQLQRGIEIGPQTPLAGSVAQQLCEMTGNERAAFCNTGSEAVVAAIRLARTVTGKQTLAIFAGAYHGIFDEVVVRGSDGLRSFPAAPGIPPAMVENILVLDYGAEKSLEILSNRADELAGILVETVQSRRPEVQPKAFLERLREITESSGSALIFDEVVTGFRVAPGGAQEYFGIRADLATYGKVVGGGLPIGIVAGKSRFMDALDGGAWQYGDDSIPEVGVTFFAGTFVRQPLALAAADAVLKRLKAEGPELQQGLNKKMAQFVAEMNTFFSEENAGYTLTTFSSWFYLTWPDELAQGSLIFYLMRSKGIHIWASRPCFFTTAHSEADITRVMDAFKESIHELQQGGFLPQPARTIKGLDFDVACPPVPGARLGRNAQGNPAWYIGDPDRPGKYLEVSSS